MLYPQNGDCIVATNSVTSRHPVYTATGVFECLCSSKLRQNIGACHLRAWLDAVLAIGNESVPKIIINNTVKLFFKTANCIFYQIDMERDMYIV